MPRILQVLRTPVGHEVPSHHLRSARDDRRGSQEPKGRTATDRFLFFSLPFPGSYTVSHSEQSRECQTRWQSPLIRSQHCRFSRGGRKLLE